VGSQVWENTTTATTYLDAAADAITQLTRQSESMTPDAFQAILTTARELLLRADLSAAAVARSAAVNAADHASLVEAAEEYNARAAEARENIVTLRKEVADEQLARDRRIQYNALAKVINREQPRDLSEQTIETERAAIAELDAEAREIEHKKTAARMEFHLLLQCVDDLEVYATTNGARAAEGASATGAHVRSTEILVGKHGDDVVMEDTR
jgi:hypothetical protein